MNTNLPSNTETAHQSTAAATDSRELAAILELLRTVGLAAEAVFDGDVEWCPHCRSQVLSEAA